MSVNSDNLFYYNFPELKVASFSYSFYLIITPKYLVKFHIWQRKAANSSWEMCIFAKKNEQLTTTEQLFDQIVLVN